MVDSSLGILQGVPLLESRLQATIGEATSTPAAATQMTMQIDDVVHEDDQEHDCDDEEDQLWREHYECCPISVEGKQRTQISAQLISFNREHGDRRQRQLKGLSRDPRGLFRLCYAPSMCILFALRPCFCAYALFTGTPWELVGWFKLTKLLHSRENTVRRQNSDTLTPAKWKVATQPGGLYFKRMERLYDHAQWLDQRHAQRAPTCACHKHDDDDDSKSTLPRTHSSLAVRQMSQHIHQAHANGTLILPPSQGSQVFMIHAAWGFANPDLWKTFESIQDPHGNTPTDAMTEDTLGSERFAKVKVTTIEPMSFSEKAQTRREQVPSAIASRDPDWYLVVLYRAF